MYTYIMICLLFTGGRYSVLPNGELLIRNAMISDGFKTYRCLTKHILSGDMQLSATSGRLIITGNLDTSHVSLLN